MNSRFVAAMAGLATALFLAATVVQAAPVTLKLQYVDGPPGYSMFGSITYDGAIRGNNVNVGGTTDLTGLLAFSLTLTGPEVPGGSTSFALSDIKGWAFTTDATGRIIDINFFGGTNATTNCTLDGVDPFILHFDCNVGGAIGNMRLVLASPSIPALEPVALALLALLIAAGAGPALRRRA